MSHIVENVYLELLKNPSKQILDPHPAADDFQNLLMAPNVCQQACIFPSYR